MRSLRNARRDRVYKAQCVEDFSRGRNTHLEKRFLPRSQYFLSQAREPIAFRFRGIVGTVIFVVVVAHVEVKKLAIVFLEILVKLRIFLSEFGQL